MDFKSVALGGIFTGVVLGLVAIKHMPDEPETVEDPTAKTEETTAAKDKKDDYTGLQLNSDLTIGIDNGMGIPF